MNRVIRELVVEDSESDKEKDLLETTSAPITNITNCGQQLAAEDNSERGLERPQQRSLVETHETMDHSVGKTVSAADGVVGGCDGVDGPPMGPVVQEENKVPDLPPASTVPERLFEKWSSSEEEPNFFASDEDAVAEDATQYCGAPSVQATPLHWVRSDVHPAPEMRCARPQRTWRERHEDAMAEGKQRAEMDVARQWEELTFAPQLSHRHDVEYINRVPIHERLFRLSKAKSKRPMLRISPAKTSNNTTLHASNSGLYDRLHQQGLKHRSPRSRPPKNQPKCVLSPRESTAVIDRLSQSPPRPASTSKFTFKPIITDFAKSMKLPGAIHRLSHPKKIQRPSEVCRKLQHLDDDPTN